MIKITNASPKFDNEIIINGARFMVTDAIASVVMDLVSGSQMATDYSTAASQTKSEEPKTKTDRKPKAYKAASDYTVPYEVRKVGKKWGLGFSQRIPQTAFKAVADKVGTDWDKEHKVFWFATKKAAEDFTKSYPVALATDRQALQDSYKKA